MAKDWSTMFAPTIFDKIDELETTDPGTAAFRPRTFNDIFAQAFYYSAGVAVESATRATPIASDVRNNLYSARYGVVEQTPFTKGLK